MHNDSVIDASPLILYGRIERLDIFTDLAEHIIIPQSVIMEVKRGATEDATAESALQWARQFQQPNISVPPSVQHWDLGRGETQVLSRCVRNNCFAVMDDRMARRCAAAHDISMTGSLGVMLKARKCSIIPEARQWVYKLIDAGLYIDSALAEKALESVGERT